MLEKRIEQHLRHAVKQAGGQCYKFTSPGTTGVPDRLILMPNGKVAFAELKAPGKKPQPHQATRIKQIQQLGTPVYIIDQPDQIPGVINEILTTPIPTTNS